MRSFGRLVTNEWLKMYKKRSFFIPYAVVAACIVFVAYMVKSFGEADQISSGLQFLEGMFENNGGIGQLLTLLAIICTAGTVAKEHSLGTIKLLLIRAQSRGKILASKYVTVLVYTLSLTLTAFAVALLTGGIAFGFETEGGSWENILVGAAIQLAYTVIYVTVTFMIGVLTRSAGASIGVGMMLVMLESLVVLLLARYDFVKYVLFANTDLSVYLEGGTPPVAGMTLTFSLIVLAAYTALFLGISFVTFRRRDVA